VVVDEDGVRRRNLTAIEVDVVFDVHPRFSPDGRWVLFSSNRSRDRVEQSSLWLVPVTGGKPARLTHGSASDRDAEFTPDGRHIVYASDVGNDTLDLWILPIDRDGKPSGSPRQLTRTDDVSELSPSVTPDGKRVVYMAVDPASQTSTLRILDLQSGKTRDLTEGPFDATPRVSPDGRTIAFAAPVKGRGDIDLFAIDMEGKHRRILAADPLGDETGPFWSPDGCWLLATSVVRSPSNGKPLVSVLVALDVCGKAGPLRALHDPGGLVSRLGVAISPAGLDPARLRRQPLHMRETLRRLQQQAEDNERDVAP